MGAHCKDEQMRIGNAHGLLPKKRSEVFDYMDNYQSIPNGCLSADSVIFVSSSSLEIISFSKDDDNVDAGNLSNSQRSKYSPISTAPILQNSYLNWESMSPSELLMMNNQMWYTRHKL
uniref:Uncharacterized protein n=1 Tax=Glossina brevipalpis TaxID=37001 RepID=A0A1A9W969_9MUSC